MVGSLLLEVSRSLRKPRGNVEANLRDRFGGFPLVWPAWRLAPAFKTTKEEPLGDRDDWPLAAVIAPIARNL